MPRQPQIQNSLVYLQPKCRIKRLWLAPTENCTDHPVSTDRHTAVQPHKDGNRREPVHIQRQHGWTSQHQQQQQHANRTGQTQKAIFCMSPFTWHRRKGDIGTRTGPWGKFSRWWRRSRHYGGVYITLSICQNSSNCLWYVYETSINLALQNKKLRIKNCGRYLK